MANLRANNITGTGGRNAIDGSVFFNGSGSYLKINDSTAWDFGADNFTIEYWYYEVTTSNTERRTAYLYGPDSPALQALCLGHTNDNSGQLFFSTHDSSQSLIGGGNVLTSSGSNPNGNREGWRHVAVVRNGGNLNIYLDGVLSGTNGSYGSTAVRSDQSDWYIGHDPVTSGRNFQGYISNYRVIKGTALYTANFTPPTEKLTVIDGTVLLCCQDSDDPTQEATGKTITAVGNLDYSDKVELVTGSWTNDSSGSGSGSGSGKSITVTGSGLSNRGVTYQTCTVVVGKKYVFSYRGAAAGANCKIGVDSNDGTNNVIGTPGNNPDLLYTQMANGNATVTSGKYYSAQFTATTTSAVLYFQEAGTGTFKADDISLKLANSSKQPKVLPPVGIDEGVTFGGDAKINSLGYMYFPTGDTSQRGRGRGLNGGSSVPSNIKNIDYFQIQSTGNSIDFGDLTVAGQHTSCSSTTRGVFAMGSNNNTISYVTIATTANAVDFGDRTIAKNGPGALSNNTRGVFCGGGAPNPQSDVMDYITIASTGNATDFGNMSSGNKNAAGLASPTRGCIAHGGDPMTNVIDYITIASTGNATDFGDTVNQAEGYLACASNIRGIWSGGYVQPANQNVIQYVTIASTGNAVDFGDIGSNRVTSQSGAGTSNNLRGVTMGGFNNPNQFSATMEYVNIDTTGNSFDFGYLTSSRSYTGSCSDSHGGLS